MSHLRPGGPIVALAIALAALAGCVAAGPSLAPSASTGEPTPSVSSAFYLRAWTTQAIPPDSAFASPARLVIADGRLIDTAVAVPAIYPGPLLIQPIVRSISAHGIATVIDALRTQGLLASQDFAAGIAPGGAVAHLEVIVDGATYELSGDPTRLVRCGSGTRCVPDPGTAEAFAAFWQQVTGDVDSWLRADLGTTNSYTPERLAVLAIPPIDPSAGPIQPSVRAWALAPFASFGTPFAGGRCGTVAGTDLTGLLPVLRESNQLTRFRDSAGTIRSLTLRVLLPDEPDACTAQAAAMPSPAAPISPSPSTNAAPSAGSSGGSAGTGNGLGVPTILGLACFGEGSVFQASALGGPASAETGTDSPAAALRTLLATVGPDTSWLPAKGWRRVAESQSEVWFLAESASEPAYVYVSVAPVPGSTSWKAGGWGQCQVMAKLASPFRSATWQLEATTSADTTSFTAFVSEMSCASGQAAGPRISDPLIVYGEKTVSVTFGVVPLLESVQTCPAPPPSPVLVHLREPLGDRQLIDGAVYPPKPVEVVNPN